MRNNYPDINFTNKTYDNYSIINNRYLLKQRIFINNICKKFINKNNNKLLWLLRS